MNATIRLCGVFVLLLAGCGQSTSSSPRPPTPTPARIVISTPGGGQPVTLVDDSRSGSRKLISNGYLFRPPRARWAVFWSFRCPSSYGYGPAIFVIFSNRQNAPLTDPGESTHSGSGHLTQQSPPGQPVILSVIAYDKCRYHVRVIG